MPVRTSQRRTLISSYRPPTAEYLELSNHAVLALVGLQDNKFYVGPELRNLRIWHNSKPIKLQSVFDWLVLEPILFRLRRALAESFRHRSACEFLTDHLPPPRSIDDNVIATTWRLIQGLATTDRVDLGVIPPRVVTMCATVLLVSERVADIMAVSKLSVGSSGY